MDRFNADVYVATYNTSVLCIVSLSVYDPVAIGMSQTTSSLLMIRPLAFGFDFDAAEDCIFQHPDEDPPATAAKAKKEFDNFVGCLRGKEIAVRVVEDTTGSPDACFPNNWFSCHADERMVVVYSMMAKSRRLERRWDVIKEIAQSNKWETLDLSRYESENKFLEGTGSMVLDRSNKIAYASLSRRTHREVLDVFCSKLGYRPVVFNATALVNGKTYPVYHTNVVMSVGFMVAVVCLDAIRDRTEKDTVLHELTTSGKEVLNITEKQMTMYAGNVLEVRSQAGEAIVVMSSQAHSSLHSHQLQKLEQYATVLHVPLPTIEYISGGSARCMMAELHDK